MEGRVDFSSLERSRLLPGGLPSGALGPSFSSNEAGHHAALSRLGASGADLSRSGSPPSLATLQSQYQGRYPGSALHSQSASYAMMAGYLANGYVPESLKNLVPDIQQCCSSSQPDGYARYLINTMYYPYLPYLPATESLSLFAQNSVSAQAQAAAAAHHRIYDLHKEAMFGPNAPPGNFYQAPVLLPQTTGQLEATNLSMSSSSKSKQGERSHSTESPRKSSAEQSAKQTTPSSSSGTSGKLEKSESHKKCSKSDQKTSSTANPCSSELDKKGQRDSRDILKFSDHKSSTKVNRDKDSSLCKESHSKDKRTLTEKHLPAKEQKVDAVFHRKVELSPPRNYNDLSSPDKRSKKVRSPVDFQDKPENLCVKDRVVSPVSTCVRTQSVVTDTTVTVTSTLNVSNIDSVALRQSPGASSEDGHPSDRTLISPGGSTDTTSTTYSLPYYHNLYFRSQGPSSLDGKKVHAVTYVPEVGTVSSASISSSSFSEDTENVSRAKSDSQSQPEESNKGDSRHGEKSSASPNSQKTEIKSPKKAKPTDLVAPKRAEEKKCKPSKRTEGSNTIKSRDKTDSPEKSPDKETHDKLCHDSKGFIEVSQKQDEVQDPKEEDKGVETISDKDSVSEKDAHVKIVPKSCGNEECDLDGSNRSSIIQKSSDRNQKKSQSEKNKENCNGVKDSLTKPPAITIPATERPTIKKRRRKDEHKDASNKVAVPVSESPAKSQGNPSTWCDMNHNSEKLRCIAQETETNNPAELRVTASTTTSTVTTVTTVSARPGSAPPVTPPLKPTTTEKHKKEEQSRREAHHTKGTTKDVAEEQPSAGSNTIPVGIAVARQRTVAPKPLNESKEKKQSTNTESHLNDGKHIGNTQRPLNIIRPATKTTPHVSASQDMRHELPANLIVTGGGSNSSGMFWPEDPASRQLAAAQFLQPGHHLGNSNWFNPGQMNFPQAPPTSGSSDTSQLPITVPAGYKLAQDSLTGQILLIPSGADMFDPNRIWNGFPLGHVQSHNGFAQPLLTGPQSQVAMAPSSQSFYTSQQHIPEGPNNVPEFTVPHYQTVFHPTVLPRPETTIKEERLDTESSCALGNQVIQPTVSPVSEMPPTVSICDASHPTGLSEKDSKVLGVPQSAFVADMTLATGQQCTYHPMPFVFNSPVMPVQGLPETAGSDITQAKPDPADVQSRGTSPMLPPAIDSCDDDNGDSSGQCEHDVNSEEISVCDEKDDSSICIDSAKLESSSPINDEKYNNSAFEGKDTQDSEEVKKSTTEDCKADDVDGHIVVKGETEQKGVRTKYADVSFSDLCRRDKSEKISVSPSITKDEPAIKECVKTPDVSSEGCEMPQKCDKVQPSPRTCDNKGSPDYNPYTDPLVLQAADGLELLCALAEKRSLCIKRDVPEETAEIPTTKQVEVVEAEPTSCNNVKSKCEDVYTFREDKDEKETPLILKKSPFKLDKERQERPKTISLAKTVKEKEKEKEKEKTKPQKPRIKCGYAFQPTVTPPTTPVIPVKYTTFCGITIPEDDDVIDSIELEMRMRLAELQRRYRDKQKELAKLKPKKDKEDRAGESKRGPGRPRKRKHCSGDSSTDGAASDVPLLQRPKSVKKEHSVSKKKKLAEMLVDRVFRKTGSSFKIPLSKKTNLIAPARIELPGGKSSADKVKTDKPSSPVDFGKLIKRSRLSQLNGKDRSFVGGLWRRKEEKRKLENSLLTTAKQKKTKNPEVAFSSDGGLGLLAEYAAKEEKKKRKRPPSENIKVLTDTALTVDVKESSSPDSSPTKKRKPGRPKKCDTVRPGVTETIVAKQSKHIDFFRWQQMGSSNSTQSDTQPDHKTSQLEVYLDEWNLRRSERIFLSDPSPQTSPKQNPLSPTAKAKVSESSVKATSDGKEKEKQSKSDAQKLQRSKNIHELSQKLKKKYSKGLNQKSRDKTTELLKASRDKLTIKRNKKRLEQVEQKMRKGSSSSDSEGDDIPLSALRAKASTPVPQTCIIDKDELKEGLRILIFMDGLFHEGAVKAIRPPDVYGAVLDNERRTRPHIYSQEEILKDTIKDVKPASGHALSEGTRICAYWSQQFSCLYPGTISRSSPNPNADKSLVNVEFDDGDSGKIPIDHIRMIPQDFEIVEYDPNPLLLLTKRRRTTNSESSESRKPSVDIPILKDKDKEKDREKDKDVKIKRGPGRPPKPKPTEDSNMDEDVFPSEKDDKNEARNVANGNPVVKKVINDSSTKENRCNDVKHTSGGDSQSLKKAKNDSLAAFVSARQLWKWSGKSTKRPGLKGKAKKEYYKSIVRGPETLMVGECAVFLSTGRPNLPYVGRIESLWEGWGDKMVVKVKWFYHPEETKGGKRLQNMKGALFRSDHEDENDVQTISHKCEVLPFQDYQRRKDVISHDVSDDVYYLAGTYQPTIGHIKFEPGVIT